MLRGRLPAESSGAPTGSPSIGLRVVSTLTVAVLCVTLGTVSFVQNRSIVNDFVWPGMDIQYRELAGAQTILDEGYGPDAAYAHERAWYNPMATWLIAGLSRLSGVAAPLAIARAGPYVNFVAPLALWVLVAVLFDKFAAVAATAAFVFAVGTQFPFYYSATYSPWFAPENFGQAWIYASLAVASRAFGPGVPLRWAVAGGVLLGAAFLTHTAPAILCGVVWVILAAIEWRRSGKRPDGPVRLTIVLAAAFLVSLPFSVQILWHYHLAIVNQFPSQSPSDLLDLNELPSLARRMAAAPILVGAIALVVRAKRPLDRGMQVVLALLAAVMLFLAANAVRLLLARTGVHLPAVVPAFHFFFYLMAVVAIGFGLALRDLASATVRWLVAGRSVRSSSANPVAGLLTCGLTLVAVVACYPQYRQRLDFTDVRREALAMSQRFPGEVVTWIRGHTAPDDVFLSTDDASLYLVAPAGRKVVATNRYFSNPYVDWVGRDADRRRMFEQLEYLDVKGFSALAEKYHVRFIVISGDKSDTWLHASGMRPTDLPSIDESTLATMPGFAIAFRTNRFGIVSVPPASVREDARAKSPN